MINSSNQPNTSNKPSPTTTSNSTSTPTSSTSNNNSLSRPVSKPTSPGNSSASGQSSICSACGKHIDGQFVRALNGQYHLECFRCRDCNQIVAEKFFPATDSRTGDKVILCERDYFRRLDLLCAKCGQALRGAHINALNKKYHLEHFTCSVCSTVFRQHDSYYEREGQVYCQQHYSLLFAAKCGGCHTAVLKNFVEMTTKVSKIEQWHPECYMIFKLWNVRIAKITQSSNGKNLAKQITNADGEVDGVAEQRHVTEEVAHILNVLSSYEESSAECISDMLLWFSGNEFEEGVLQASRLIYHIESLFRGIDIVKTELHAQGESILIHNYNEPKQLAKRVVHFFSLLSYSKNGTAKEALTTGTPIMGSQTLTNDNITNSPSTPMKQQTATKEMISLVTSLAHTLKILIRAALIGALKLERVYGETDAVHLLLNELESCNEKSLIDIQSLEEYGPDVKTDLCTHCHRSIEEECYKYDNLRWHSSCFICGVCGRELKDDHKNACYDALGNRILCSVHYEHMSKLPAYRVSQSPTSDGSPPKEKLFVNVIKPVTQLEQYVFLLRCALKRLCILLNVKMESYPAIAQKDSVAQSPGSKPSPANRPPSPSSTPGSGSATDSYFNLDSSTSILAHSDVKSPTSPQGLNSRVASAGKLSTTQSQAQLQKSKVSKIATTSTNTLAGDVSQLSLISPQVPSSPDSSSKPSINTSTTSLSSSATRVSPQKPRSQIQSKNAVRAQKTTGVGAGSENSRFLSELSVLDHWAVRQHAAQLLYPYLNKEFTMEQLMDCATLRKPSMWSKMVDVLKPKKDKQQPEILFGVPLEILLDKYGVDSDLGVGFSGVQIPLFVDYCIRVMLRQDLSVEGIFRKNGNIKKMKTTATQLDEDPGNVEVLETESVIQLAALLKKFLRDLPEPLLTFKLYRLFIVSQKIPEEQRMQVLHYICSLLPKPNLDLLATLVWFCHHIAKESHMDSPPGVGNKMDIANLAMVMAPNILYSKSAKSVTDDDALLAITAIHTMFDNYEQLWQIPADIYERIRGDDYPENGILE